jgi:polyisoprenyl-teichoic acid--peptidoglycan teichoic acid transferase
MSALETRRNSRRQRANRAVYWRRRITVFGTIFVLMAAVLGTYWFWNKPLNQGALPEATTAFDTNRFTMLVIGADDRPGAPGRSDTMMLGFVDLEQGSVKLLSIPRDSYVPIPEHGWDKINASYPLGGPALVQQTVEQLAGIPINYSVTVNMQGFAKIVDAVNGVDIDIPENMNYEDPYDDPPLEIHLKKGLQHLDGTDALHFVRFRHDAENDWGRMKRQQQFLSALAKAALQPSNLSRLPTLVKLGSQNVQTNLSLGQLTKLAMLAKEKMGADKITGETLAGDDIWAPDGYYLGLKFAEMREKVRELAGITPDDKLLAQDKKDAAAYEAGLPQGSPTPVEEPAPAPAPAPAPEQKKPDEATKPGTGTPGTPATGTGTGGTTTAPGTGTGTTKPGTGGTTQPGTGGTTTTPGTTKPGTGTGTGTGTGSTSGSTSGGTTTTPGTGTAPKKP